MMSEPSHTTHRASFGPRDIANTFFRHKKKAVFFAFSIIGLATLVLLFAPRKYRSEARLFLQVGRESVRLDPTATTGQMIGLQQSGRDNEVASAMEILRSRGIIEKVVDRLTPEVVMGQSGDGQAEPNPVADYALAPLRYAVRTIKSIDPISNREEAIVALSRNFEVDAEHDSTVLVLTVDAETPKLAQQIMQAIVEVYSEEHVRLHRTTGSKDFFVQQRDELQKELTAAEDAFRKAKSRMGLASIDSRRNSIETRLSGVEVARNSTHQGIAAAEAQIAELKSQLQALPERLHTSTHILPNTGADTLRSQLYTLQVKLLDLEAKYKADHPLVASTRAQVEEAKSMLEKEVDTREETVDSLNENHRALALELAQAEGQLSGFKAQLTELNAQRSAALADLKQLNDFDVEADELDRTVKLANAKFQRYDSDLEEARIDDELNNQRIINIVVAQEPTFGEKPISPSKMLVGALSLVLATAGTMALVLGSEKFDSRLRSEEQVEQVLRLPVLAAVPESRAFGAVPVAR